MNKPLLTVIIPTYNRENLATDLLKKLIPLKKDWVELVVLDNNSKNFDFINQQILTNRWPVKLFQNKHNVGGNENLLRCFEYTSGDWIWAIGDDDIVEDNCFEIIFKLITSNELLDAFGIHFNWELNKKYSKDLLQINNLEELFTNMHSLGDINFMSSNIFQYKFISDFLDWTHYHQYNCNPMSMVIMLGIDKNRNFYFSNLKIIQNGFYTKAKNKNDFWDVEIVIKANSLLAEIPVSEKSKLTIINLLLKIFTPWLAFKGAVREYMKGSSKRVSLWSYREMLKHQFVYGSFIKLIYINLLQFILFVFIKPLSGLYKKVNK